MEFGIMIVNIKHHDNGLKDPEQNRYPEKTQKQRTGNP